MTWFSPLESSSLVKFLLFYHFQLCNHLLYAGLSLLVSILPRSPMVLLPRTISDSQSHYSITPGLVAPPVGEVAGSVDVDMRFYTEMMNTVPQESVSVPLIMHAMLEQVGASTACLKEPVTQPNTGFTYRDERSARHRGLPPFLLYYNPAASSAYTIYVEQILQHHQRILHVQIPQPLLLLLKITSEVCLVNREIPM